jgi:SAM-dependent methyltransferase
MLTDTALRRAQDEAFAKISIDGSILDVGGARRNSYHAALGGEHTITFANLYPQYEPDLVFDAEERWPIEDASYDAVVMNNLLEHLYRPRECVAEACRVLRPGGLLVGSTPFLYRVHAGPSDYYRFTAFALRRMFEDAGFGESQVEPIGGAFVVSADLITKPLNRIPILYRAGLALAGALDRVQARFRPHGDLSADYCPSGYFFTARRPVPVAGDRSVQSVR